MTRLSAILSLLSILLVGCGMSQEDKNNIAAVTCSVMGETRNMDAAIRVREINLAREKLGEPPYLGGDDGIKESFEWGLCQQLVLNAPTYDSTLEELQRIAAEERRQREEREAEERRQREEREAEERRQREEREAEERRQREEARRQWKKREPELRRQIAEGVWVWTCPSTAEEKTLLVRTALDQGNTELYKFVTKCPRL